MPVFQPVKFARTVVVNGKEHTVALVRNGPFLTGTLPLEVQTKYKIKTFRCGSGIRQEFVPVRVDRFRDQDKLWVDENASPSTPGVEGSVFYQWDNNAKINLTAVVEFDPNIPGIPPVYA